MSPREASACDLLSADVSLTDAQSRNVPTRHFTLATYDNSGFSTGASFIRNLLWYFVGGLIFETRWFPFRSLKVVMLRWFGSHVGFGVVIKPQVRIKFPWRLRVGDHTWIGQHVWIDNLALVELGNDVCVSQGAFLCTGSHDHSSSTFALITRPIRIEDGAWVAAKAIVLGGVTVGPESLVAAGAVVLHDVPANTIVAGNPSRPVGLRKIRPDAK